MRPAALLREAAADMAAAAGLTPQQLAGPGQHNDPLAQYGIIPTSQPAVATPRGGTPARSGTVAAAAALAPAGAASTAIQQSIARIHEACQAPPMSPHEYRVLFEVMAKEISENDLIGAQNSGQHYATCAGEGPGGASRRRALRARGGQRGRSVVRAGRLGQPVCWPLPQLRGGALPRPGSQFVRRRVGPDRRMVRRRLAAAGACAVTCQVAFWWHARDR